MGKSINPMWSSFQTQGEAVLGLAPGLIVLMSLQPAIPWRVALQQSSPPLYRLDSMYHPSAETVNHHPARAGEFSTGTLGNFRSELTFRVRRRAASPQNGRSGGPASGFRPAVGEGVGSRLTPGPELSQPATRTWISNRTSLARV